jgi:hypothetical protein
MAMGYDEGLVFFDIGREKGRCTRKTPDRRSYVDDPEISL